MEVEQWTDWNFVLATMQIYKEELQLSEQYWVD